MDRISRVANRIFRRTKRPASPLYSPRNLTPANVNVAQLQFLEVPAPPSAPPPPENATPQGPPDAPNYSDRQESFTATPARPHPRDPSPPQENTPQAPDLPPPNHLIGEDTDAGRTFLGRGGGGSVEGYYNSTVRNFVAVKYIDNSHNRVREVTAEVAVFKKLQEYPHPHLVSLVTRANVNPIQTSRGRDDTHIMMDYHPTCLIRICHVSLPPESVLSMLYATVAREIAAGLTHLHKLGIIHRDIKPDNILISQDGHCVIADYGHCILSQDADKDSVVQPGSGTRSYAAPEVQYATRVDGLSGIDKRVDFWSLGATLYDAIGAYTSVNEPNGGDTLDGGMHMRMELELHGSPPELTDVILSLCQRKREDRIHGEKLFARLDDMSAGGESGRDPPFNVIWSPLAKRPLLQWNTSMKPRRRNSTPQLKSKEGGDIPDSDHRHIAYRYLVERVQALPNRSTEWVMRSPDGIEHVVEVIASLSPGALQ